MKYVNCRAALAAVRAPASISWSETKISDSRYSRKISRQLLISSLASLEGFLLLARALTASRSLASDSMFLVRVFLFRDL